MNKEQQCRTSKKEVKLLHDIFLNKQSFRRNIQRVLCLFVIPLSHGSGDSVVQSTDGVCSSKMLEPFLTSQYPNGGVLLDEYGSVCPPTFGGGGGGGGGSSGVGGGCGIGAGGGGCGVEDVVVEDMMVVEVVV